MKKEILLIFGLILTVSICSCKKNKITKGENITETIGISSEESDFDKVDFNWTKMNYNMLTSLEFDVQVNPKKYVNKRVKVSGNFQTSVYEDQRYYSVLIWDPTGCCPAGFDFIPPENMQYPDDFPEIDEKITVTCVFKYFEENNEDYIILQAEKIFWENKILD